MLVLNAAETTVSFLTPVQTKMLPFLPSICFRTRFSVTHCYLLTFFPFLSTDLLRRQTTTVLYILAQNPFNPPFVPGFLVSTWDLLLMPTLSNSCRNRTYVLYYSPIGQHRFVVS